jgi:hypothetical protein
MKKNECLLVELSLLQVLLSVIADTRRKRNHSRSTYFLCLYWQRVNPCATSVPPLPEVFQHCSRVFSNSSRLLSTFGKDHVANFRCLLYVFKLLLNSEFLVVCKHVKFFGVWVISGKKMCLCLHYILFYVKKLVKKEKKKNFFN